MTKKLFWTQPYEKEFEATIQIIKKEGIILDQTLFYPRSGGQASDRGILKVGDLEFDVKTVLKENDKIIHQISSEFLDKIKVGNIVIGVIDWEYRYGLMKAHSSQHIFSAIVKKNFDIDTIRVDINFEEVALQLSKKLSFNQLKTVFTEVNRIFTIENIEINGKIVSYKEAINFHEKIRGKELPKHDNIRLIESENYDLTACGGTHVQNSTEIGPLIIYEFKRGVDIKYYVGAKALTGLSDITIDILEFSNSINKPLMNFKENIDKRSNLIENLQRDNINLTIKILNYGSEHPYFKLGDVSVSYIDIQIDNKTLSKEFKNFPLNSLLIIKLEEKKFKVLSNCKDIIANELIQYLTEKYGGKGGGSNFSAQCALNKIPKDILNDLELFLSKK